MQADTGTLDEAYERLHQTGPEFEGWLSNHGPMVVESMVRRNRPDSVHGWLGTYLRRLEDFPDRQAPIGDNWQSALGDPRRIADWTDLFRNALAEASWEEVLNGWWPRLLPGVAASATHGVIRVGHAVRALRNDEPDDLHLDELGQALAYWAARWQPVPGASGTTSASGASGAPDGPGASGPSSPGDVRAPISLDVALDRVPRIPDQSGGVLDRLGRLGELDSWPGAVDLPIVPPDLEAIVPWLERLVDTAVSRYLRYGQANAVMLVHSATAPNAILRTLPALDQSLWGESAGAAWKAVGALTAIYAPFSPAEPEVGDDLQPDDVFDRALSHGDEHVIKLADTALDAWERQAGCESIAAVVLAMELIEPLRER